MHSPTFPTSPLAVIHTTFVVSTLASTVLLPALVFALLDPVWSRAALALQVVTLAAMGLARRWGPPRRFATYALLLAGSTILWDPTLPPTALPDEPVRHLLPLVVSMVVLADLLGREVISFRPARVGVYAGLVDLHASRLNWLHGRLAARNARLVAAPDGATLVVLEDALAVLHQSGLDPGGPARPISMQLTRRPVVGRCAVHHPGSRCARALGA